MYGVDAEFLELLKHLKKGDSVEVSGFHIKEGETSPPKRYNSGSMILAMENAGQLIDDEELQGSDQGQRHWHQRHSGRDPEEVSQ